MPGTVKEEKKGESKVSNYVRKEGRLEENE
jgi:hypothetical protein